MQVIANRQLHGEYGTVIPDQMFECRDETAQELLKSGMVRNPKPPKVQYETKIIRPTAPEASPRETFRHVPVSNAQPQAVAPEGDRLLPVADLSTDRTTDPRGRGGRSGSRSGR
jgi:hypothetical protein